MIPGQSEARMSYAVLDSMEGAMPRGNWNHQMDARLWERRQLREFTKKKKMKR
jgi:hypothetical protein